MYLLINYFQSKMLRFESLNNVHFLHCRSELGSGHISRQAKTFMLLAEIKF